MPLNILIVEDDPMMRLGLTHSLAHKETITIIGEASDGYQGVAMAASEQPHVVLMDVGMPRMDGIAATQEIKQRFPNIRVVVFTSHTDQTEVIAALSSGADAYCIKGTNIDTLMQAINVAASGGIYLDPQIAQQVVTCLTHQPPAPIPDHPLSARELEVLKLIVEGYSNPEIGEKLFLSTNTVKTYVKGIMNKLVVNDRVQAAVLALRRGWVS
ncbi:DNA-binding response regulator [Leptolyngbyaceae cyanobacterium CCMR0082]|uniref:DNA-binding response regulator n=2 Tax=Adonisia turfae TaxID=2950184 RepID=A0A6M0RZH0_9CYAN|nr:response regulator transcription factor [Adonisia turfae]MDV3349764.1 response regulator transcription factor [Leptothoe sp. LEGE 181152]NEZ54771.1 DNA-binding response regulator [Adonisia turfae CCMR0081]NEZ61283.1 DNA-binding response regulator [Adonisia turfae CCMR0082]